MATEILTGTVERITYYNPENGYSVVKVAPNQRYPQAEARDGTVAVVGSMPELVVGEDVRFSGQWIDDSRYGRQFRAETVTPVVPTNRLGIINYLSSGIVSGIGVKTAERIYDHFGDQTLDILDRDPERIYEVGLKEPLARKLIQVWGENQALRQAMVFLQGYGVSSRMATRIYKEYGFNTVQTVRTDPYTLADDVFGIGFVKADQIADKMGVERDADVRLRAGLTYALNQLAREGHVYAPRDLLVSTAAELLKTERVDRLRVILGEQLEAGELILDRLPASEGDAEEVVYLPLYYEAETGAAEMLRRLKETPSPITRRAAKLKWASFLSELAEANEVALTEQQQSAVQAALTHKVSILTGGPGTGKTTTLRMVIEALETLKFRYALASPTGRAAKRLAEATGRPASAIHRLLGFIPGEGFEHDEDNPLDIDALILDETSMLDLLLFHDVLKALRPQTHLLVVGDADQLPSVGAGNVLRDVIASGEVFVTRLDVIFRQQNDSYIIVNAHRVNRGEAPFTDNKSTDFFFFTEEDPQRTAELVVNIIINRLPARFGYNPLEDIQVLAPMYRGPAGVEALNNLLQSALNGDRRMAEKNLGGRVFRVGDKVMQTRNNYLKEVFNGDIGRIYAIDFEENILEVALEGRLITYEWSEADELIHAYCISTHRSQGSEYPAIVMPVLTQHYMMLQRNLLYTAITRAKQTVVLVGSRKAVHIAVGNNKVAARFSGLPARLKAEAAG